MRKGIATLLRAAKDETAAALLEFALLAPVICMTVMGLFELAHQMYVTSVLEGALHKAARDNTLKISANGSLKLNQKIRGAVQEVIPTADVFFKRAVYTNYSDIGTAEDFTDSNGDGRCNDGEPFEDVNYNGTWDSDRGIFADHGSASDAVVYNVRVRYKRLFPVAALLGFEKTAKISRSVVLRNQPFSAQNIRSVVGYCP